MKRFIAFLIIALFTSGIGLMFSNCGARKKTTSQTEIETAKKDTLSAVATSSGSIATRVNTVEQTIKSEQKKEIAVEVKNGEQLQIDEFDANGKLKSSKVFKGSGKATVKETDQNQASAKVSQSAENSEFKNDLKVNSSSSEDTKAEGSEMNLDRKESFSWPLMWILFLAIAIFILHDVNKRRKSM